MKCSKMLSMNELQETDCRSPVSQPSEMGSHMPTSQE